MKHRKHRLFIDATFNVKVSKREAAKGLQLFLDDNLDIVAKSIYASDNTYIDKLSLIEPTRKSVLLLLEKQT